MNIFNAIDTLDHDARIAALRSLIHSCYSRGIGALRAHLNQEQRKSRQELDPNEEQLSVDVRNMVDQISERDAPVGLEGFPNQLELAQKLANLACYADIELQTLTPSAYEQPMDFAAMLKYMTDRPRKVDPALAKAVADHLYRANHVKIDVERIVKLVEVNDNADRLRLLEQAPDIIALWGDLTVADSSFGKYAEPTCIDDLDLQTKLGLIIKTINGVKRTSERTLVNVLRMRRISDLSKVTVLDDAVRELTEQLREFEQRNAGEIQALIDAGRNIPELEAA